jgi:hypothetical protein
MSQRILRVSPELMAEFLKRPTPPGLTAQGMPEDARIVDARWDWLRKCITLFVESASFEEAYEPDGDPPLLDLTFTRAFTRGA